MLGPNPLRKKKVTTTTPKKSNLIKKGKKLIKKVLNNPFPRISKPIEPINQLFSKQLTLLLYQRCDIHY